MAAPGEGEPKGASANKLNRELLRWIQSLDLAYSIKNVKRDFANGFLVAEILSRYYDKDVSMHSYDNGIGIKVKKDNWEQLTKLFARFEDLEPLASKADMDAIIHCQNGAAVAFLTKLYQCLTKRSIQPTAAAPAPPAAAPSITKALDTMDEIPPYAKTTNSAFIREKMREPEIAELSDRTELSRKVRDIHSQHEETQQQERLLTEPPERYPALRSANKATVLRGATKPVRNDDSNPVLMTQQIVREVQIKAINQKSLEKLRATREAQENDALGFLGHNSGSLLADGRGGVASFDTHAAGARGLHGSSSSNPELVQRRKPMDLLGEAVMRKLGSMAIAARMEQRGGKGRFENFVDNAYEGRVFTENESAEVLHDIAEDADVLAPAFLDFPRDFWKFTGLLTLFLVESDDENVLFRAVEALLMALGQQCVRRDGSASTLLMTEFLLPKLVPSLSRHAAKRAPMLRMLLAFVPETVLAHIQAIKSLRETLADNIPLFVHLLAILLGMEKELDETLVDLYHYYCCIGLETPCEKLRAACLSMLLPFLNYDMALVLDLLPRLAQLSARHAWWEVKAQLLLVASAFLHIAPSHQPQDDEEEDEDEEEEEEEALDTVPGVKETARDLTEQIELCLAIIEREFHPDASLNLRRIGLAYLAKNLSNYQELVPLYVDVLFSLPPAVRHVMLLDQEKPSNADEPAVEGEDEDAVEAARRTAIERQLPVRGASGASYELLPLAPNWDSVVVAKQIFYEQKGQRVADPEMLLVLLRCFEQLLDAEQQSNVRVLYEQMKGYVVLGFARATTCELSAAIVKVALVASTDAESTDLFQHVALLETLQTLVTNNVEDVRQQTAVKLLHDAHRVSPVWAERVQHCVNGLRAECDPEVFKVSLFSIALDLDG